MKRTKGGSTPKQYAYAVKKLNGQGRSKKDMALSVGFSPSVANNVENKIENTEGFQNAVIKLAAESNNLVLAVMAEFKARGLTKFSNKDLVGAMNAISSAWERFEKHRGVGENRTPEGNKLKAVIMQRIENQTIHIPAREVDASPQAIKPEGPGLDLDF